MSTLTELISLLNVCIVSDVKAAHTYLRDRLPKTIAVNTVCEGSLHEPSQTEGSHTEPSRTRFILFVINKTNANISPLHSEANGIIIQFDSDNTDCQWSTLVTPTQVLLNVYNKQTLTKNIKNYTIELAHDGTIVSLYYYNSKWRISTARGIEVNDVLWMSNKTYATIINEVLTKYELTLDCLDISKYYTFGFHHPDFHPFTEEINAWNITTPGLNAATISAFSTHQSVQFAPNYSREKIVDMIFSKNSYSLKNYVEKKEIHYGYILRSGTKNLFLESALYSSIKKIYYVKPRPESDSKYELMNSIIQRQMLQVNYRNMYVVLRAYMDYRIKYVALSLFPKFKEMYDEFDKFFNELAITTLLHIHDNALPLACKKEGAIPTVHEKSLDNLLAKVCAHIRRNGGISPTDSDSKSIITDFLMDENYTHVYVNYLVN
jgi:hypothetical protein